MSALEATTLLIMHDNAYSNAGIFGSNAIGHTDKLPADVSPAEQRKANNDLLRLLNSQTAEHIHIFLSAEFTETINLSANDNLKKITLIFADDNIPEAIKIILKPQTVIEMELIAGKKTDIIYSKTGNVHGMIVAFDDPRKVLECIIRVSTVKGIRVTSVERDNPQNDANIMLDDLLYKLSLRDNPEIADKYLRSCCDYSLICSADDRAKSEEFGIMIITASAERDYAIANISRDKNFRSIESSPMLEFYCNELGKLPDNFPAIVNNMINDVSTVAEKYNIVRAAITLSNSEVFDISNHRNIRSIKIRIGKYTPDKTYVKVGATKKISIIIQNSECKIFPRESIALYRAFDRDRVQVTEGKRSFTIVIIPVGGDISNIVYE